MKKVCVVLCLLLAYTCVAADAPLLSPQISEAIQQRTDASEYPIIVVGIVNGERSAVYSFGKLDNGSRPDAGTAFEIGSVTKTFTALLLAQQVTNGNLQLDAPVATLLPGFKLPSRNGKVITLGNLATQSSGLPRLPTNFIPANQKDPYADYGPDQLKAFLASYTLPRDPSASYEYSNLGVGLLGYALGQHAGVGYEKLVQEQIFRPLGMYHSTINQDSAVRARLATGHDALGEVAGNWHFDTEAAAGGIVSTGEDMLSYLKANMGVQPSALYPAMQLAQTPRASGPGPNDRIGLIWMTQHHADGDIIWHNGMTGGYASFIGFTADRRHGVVILTNIQLSVDNLGFAILIPGFPLDHVHKRVAVSSQALDDYVGNYLLRPGFVISVFRIDDQLMTQATGQKAFPLFASGTNEFFANVADISVSFKRDEHGKVTTMVLHQHGDHIAPRLGDAEADANGNKAIALDPATLAGYVGHYKLTPQAAFYVSLKDGQLLAKLADQPTLPLYASAQDKFFYRAVDAKIDFERDPHGKVIALVLHQHGTDMRAIRVAD